jgi:hypothetical protein
MPKLSIRGERIYPAAAPDIKEVVIFEGIAPRECQEMLLCRCNALRGQAAANKTFPVLAELVMRLWMRFRARSVTRRLRRFSHSAHRWTFSLTA